MWIEIVVLLNRFDALIVTPYAGVWIEIIRLTIMILTQNVTPYAGVWIEIRLFWGYANTSKRHSLRGSVD